MIYLLSDPLRLIELEHTTVPIVEITGIIDDLLINNPLDTSFSVSFVERQSIDKGGTPLVTCIPSVVNNAEEQAGGS